MLLKAIGMANLRIFLPRGPLSISMFVFAAAIHHLENGRKFSFLNSLIATYGKQVDFVNFDTLKPIAQILK
jgi:hypothetical protein